MTEKERPERSVLSWVLLLALAMGLYAGCRFGEPPEASPADVEATLQRFVAAWEAEDLNAALAFFRPGAIVLDPAPPGKFQGTEAIRGWISDFLDRFDGISIELSETHMVARGRVVWQSSRYRIDAEEAGAPARLEGYVSMVWLLMEDGSYQIGLFHASPLPEAQAPTLAG